MEAHHQPHLDYPRPHVTMPEKACADNVADVGIVGTACAPTPLVAKLLAEGAKVLSLASVAKEPAYVIQVRMTVTTSIMTLHPPKQSPATELAPTLPRMPMPMENPYLRTP